LYRELTDRIRPADVDVVKPTAGMGGDIVFGGTENPLPTVAGTDMVGASERVAQLRNACLKFARLIAAR
jgi:uncharacterized protein (DUF849 family)